MSKQYSKKSDSMKYLKAVVACTVELVATQHQSESQGWEILQLSTSSSQSADGRSDHNGSMT